jgi:hypothetical protein
MQSVIALMQHASQYPLTINLALLGNDSLITRSRNTLVSTFLNDTNMTHLLFVDADIGFDPRDVIRMISADKDVVAGMYPLKVYDWQNEIGPSSSESREEAALHYVGTPLVSQLAEWDGDFVTASYGGTGMMLIRREAIERMIEAYPNLQYQSVHVHPRPARTPKIQYALFECMIDSKLGIYLSEDYAFCQRWRDMGGTIWIDTLAKLTHTGQHTFPGNPALRYGRTAP